MHYFRAYKFVFDNPKWGLNLLCGAVCQIIPVLGQLVFLGYSYDVIEALHRRGDTGYPDFDFNRFVKYLVRGVWPFIMQLIVSLPVSVLSFVLFVTIMAAGGSGGGDSRALFLILFAVFFVFLLGVSLLVALALVPLSLRAGLSQEFAIGPSLAFLQDFWKRVFSELLLSQLFLLVTSPFVVLAGLLICCIGAFPAATLVALAQHHLHYQLYELYLQRGGAEIPLQVESVEPG